MKLKKMFWLAGFLVLLIASPGFSEVKNLDLSRASGSSQAVYDSGRWELKTDPSSSNTILSETRPQIQSGTHQYTEPTLNTFPTVKLGVNLGGTGSDGNLDLSLGCYGHGMTWVNNFEFFYQNSSVEHWSGPTCLINTDVKSVFNFTTVNIPNGTHLRATGSNALKIYATGNVTIGGVISVSAAGSTPGPGGYGPGQGPGAGQSITTNVLATYRVCPSGGGAGGVGGTGYNTDAGGTRFAIAGGNSYSLEPIDRGGSGGGSLTYNGLTAPGGVGGGVVLIESNGTMQFNSTGKVFAAGGYPTKHFRLNGTLGDGTCSGDNSYCINAGAGGGGKIILSARNIIGNSATLSIRGGYTGADSILKDSYGLGNGAGGWLIVRSYAGGVAPSFNYDIGHGGQGQWWGWSYAGGSGVLQNAPLSIESAPVHCAGTFISTIHDLLSADTLKIWEYATHTPSSTSVQVKIRHGSTPSYDPMLWSDWVNVPSSGSSLPLGSRYVQYRVDITGGGTSSCTASPTFGYVSFKKYSYFSGPGVVATDGVQSPRAGLINGVSINQNTPANTSINWAVSTDGSTWKMYSGGAWQNISSIVTGNSANEIAGIPSTKWQELGLGLIRFAFAMGAEDPNKTPSVSGISVNYSPLQVNAGFLVCPLSIYRGQVGTCSVTASSNYYGTLSYQWSSSSGATINPSGNTTEISFDSRGAKTVRVRVYVDGAPEADVTKTASIDITETPKPSVLIDGPRSVFQGQEASYGARVICPPGFNCLSEFNVDGIVYPDPVTVGFLQLRSYTIIGAAWVAGFPDTRVESTIKVYVSEMKKPFVSISAPRLAEVGVPITLKAFLSARFGTPVGYWTLPDGSRVDGTELIYTPTQKTDNLRLSYSAYIEGYPDTFVTFESRVIKVDTYELPQFKIKSYVRGSEGYAPYAIALGVTGDMARVIDYGVNLTHRWDLGDGTVKDGRNPKMVSHIYSHPGTYTITLTVDDERGNSISDSITLTVLDVPEISVQSFKVFASNKYNRVPLNVFARAFITGGHPRLDKIASYQWTVNGESVGEDRITSINFSEPGDYIIGLSVTSASGKTAYGEYPITVNPNQPPRCTISYMDYPRMKTTKIVSSCSDPDGRILEYNWDLGNGFTSKNSRVYVKYEESGTYNVTLRVKDNSGEEAVFSESVTIQR